uniref:HAT C-terminal dimerisation domain-containing protein n=1 Tax=Globodera rostochiensis TaxID=31243 RepID=A0A914I0Q3_GLORO
MQKLQPMVVKVARRVSLEEVEVAEEVTEGLLQDEQSSEGPSKKKRKEEHPRAYAELEPKLNAWNEMRKLPKKTVQKGTENPSDIRLALGVVKTNVYSEGSKRKRNIDDKLAMCLSIPHIPINIFVHELLIKFVHELDESYQSTDHSVREVVDILKSQIIRRFKSLWEIGDTNFDPTYLIASALDPNTISMLDENEISRAASYIISMITMPSQENPSPKNAHIQSSSSLESFRAHFKQARERSRSASGDKLTAQAITNEALKFLNDCPGNIDPIVYWNSAKKELEPVKELAFKIFAIPATAAPIERVWSKAGSATVHQRSLTKYELLNDQLIVYVNEYLNPQLFSD